MIRKILLQRQQKTPKDTKTHKIKMRWNVVNVKDTKRNHTSLWNAAFYYTPVKSCNYISNKADTICPWTGRQSDKQTPARAHKTMFVVLLSRTTFFLDDTHTYVHTCTCRGESFRVISVFKLLTVIWALVLISLRGSFSYLCPCISQSSNVPTFRSYQCTCGYFRFKDKLPIMHWLWWGKLSIEIFLKSYFCCSLAMRGQHSG